jgi:hypothetical protein
LTNHNVTAPDNASNPELTGPAIKVGIFSRRLGRWSQLSMFEDIVINKLGDGEGLLLLSICFLYYAFHLLFDGTNNPPVKMQRMNWVLHKEEPIISRGYFRRMYIMDPPVVDKLVLLLDVTLKSNTKQTFCRSPAGPIITEL